MNSRLWRSLYLRDSIPEHVRSLTMTTDSTTDTKGAGKYAEVNGLNLYYETHGAGRPLILLHGGLMSSETFGPVLPLLSEHHQVIAPDLQGHGRTADIDRPIDVRLMADDIAALIDHLGLEKPDLVGYSLGGGGALHTEAKDFDFADEVRGLQVPTLIVAADADMAPPSHYVEVFKLLGGGLRDGGWMGEGRPAGGHALAILPGLTHYNIGVSPLFAAVILAFLDHPS